MPEYEPIDRYLESPRLRLHYVVWGDESKPPLVLQHGGRARSWDFRRERRTVGLVLQSAV